MAVTLRAAEKLHVICHDGNLAVVLPVLLPPLLLQPPGYGNLLAFNHVLVYAFAHATEQGYVKKVYFFNPLIALFTAFIDCNRKVKHRSAACRVAYVRVFGKTAY